MAEIHLGRVEEAEAALKQVLAKDPENADAIANSLVLNVIAGKDSSELRKYAFPSCAIQVGNLLTSYYRTLEGVDPDHQLLQDLEEKSAFFDKAAAKYSAKVSA